MSIPEINLVFDEPVQRKKVPKHLADYSPEERRDVAKTMGLPAFRATQVATHYFSHLSNDPQTWSDIPADLRQTFADQLTPKLIELVRSVSCDEGMTRKDLWKLHDGVLVESVLMRYTDRVTVCISSQAGCGMNCPSRMAAGNRFTLTSSRRALRTARTSAEWKAGRFPASAARRRLRRFPPSRSTTRWRTSG